MRPRNTQILIDETIETNAVWHSKEALKKAGKEMVWQHNLMTFRTQVWARPEVG